MTISINGLREIARTNPGALTAADKNRLLADRLGQPDTVDTPPTPTEPAAGSSGNYRRLVESVGADMDDGLPGLSGSLGYRRAGGARRDLSPAVLAALRRMSQWLYDNSPPARRVIDRTVNMIVGEGVSLQAEHENEGTRKKIQEVLDDFWRDSRNQMDVVLPGRVKSLLIDGELMLTVGVNQANGKVRLAFLSPEVVRDVVPERLDVERPEWVLVADMAESNSIAVRPAERKERKLRVVREIEAVAAPLAESELTKDVEKAPSTAREETGRLAGDVLYFGVNRLSGRCRGRPDAEPWRDWVQALDDALWRQVVNRSLLSAFVWDVTINGADQKAIDAFIANNPPPEPGSVQAHNENVSWQAQTPDLRAADFAQDMDSIINYMANGTRLPATWLGRNDDPNRASAIEIGAPSYKDMTAFQREIRYLLETIARLVIDQAVAAGTLPKDVTHKNVKVVLPELSVTDLSRVMPALSAVASAGTVLRDGAVIDTEVLQDWVSTVSSQMGVEIDLEAMRQRIEKEKKEREEKAAAFPYDQADAQAYGAAAMAQATGQLPPGGAPPDQGGPPQKGGDPTRRRPGSSSKEVIAGVNESLGNLVLYPPGKIGQAARTMRRRKIAT